MSYFIEEWRDGVWLRPFVGRGTPLTHAAEILSEADAEQGIAPRRVVDAHGRLIFSGRHCSRNTPVNDIKPLWVVLSLDKPGPCERGEKPYKQHGSKAAAQAEARRLSSMAQGDRFGVLELVHVVGWVDFDLEVEIPF